MRLRGRREQRRPTEKPSGNQLLTKRRSCPGRSCLMSSESIACLVTIDLLLYAALRGAPPAHPLAAHSI